MRARLSPGHCRVLSQLRLPRILVCATHPRVGRVSRHQRLAGGSDEVIAPGVRCMWSHPRLASRDMNERRPASQSRGRCHHRRRLRRRREQRRRLLPGAPLRPPRLLPAFSRARARATRGRATRRWHAMSSHGAAGWRCPSVSASRRTQRRQPAFFALSVCLSWFVAAWFTPPRRGAQRPRGKPRAPQGRHTPAWARLTGA